MHALTNRFVRRALYGTLVLVILIALFAYLSRDNLFRYLNDPHVPFQTYTPPPAPDYAQNAAWAMPPKPDKNGDAVSIFVVTPTVYWGGKDWNMPLDAKKPLRRLWRVAIPNWAGPFQGLGQVVIPYYRSASLDSFLTIRDDARGARRLAFEDVLQAFDAFLARTGGSGPIILAGTEQGGLHVLGLLQERFDDPYLRERLAAAYVIDFATPQDLFAGPLKGLAPCADATKARCIISYGDFQKRQKDEIRRFTDRTMVWNSAGKLTLTKDRPLTCVNPVLGAATAKRAPRRAHRGGVNATGLEWGVVPAPLPAQTSAQCAGGILLVDRPKSASLRRKPGFGNHFKPPPFNLFYADIAHDARQRLHNWRALIQEQGRLAPPLGTTVEIRNSPVRKVPE